ncbi:MAG: hypothetical protein ABEJ55_03760 [Halanaeroarchaeum sp.]
MVWIISDLVEVVSLFLDVATFDVASPLLLLFAVGILTVSIGAFGLLALGGVLSAVAQN